MLALLLTYFAWQNGGDDLTSFLSTVTESAGAGDIFWSLFGHDDACCQFVEHDDGESFYYLRQNATNLYIDRGQILVQHAGQITGVSGRFIQCSVDSLDFFLIPSAVSTPFEAVACPQTKFPKALLPPGFQP